MDIFKLSAFKILFILLLLSCQESIHKVLVLNNMSLNASLNITLDSYINTNNYNFNILDTTYNLECTFINKDKKMSHYILFHKATSNEYNYFSFAAKNRDSFCLIRSLQLDIDKFYTCEVKNLDEGAFVTLVQIYKKSGAISLHTTYINFLDSTLLKIYTDVKPNTSLVKDIKEEHLEFINRISIK